MKLSKRFMCLTLIAVVISISTIAYIDSVQSKVAPTTPQQVVKTGTIGCLQHADTSGPVTLECAFGLHADDDGWF